MRSLFAAGECKPGAPELADSVARTMSETKVAMSAYARDMMTGRYPTGAPLAGGSGMKGAGERGSGVKGAGEEEDLTSRLQEVTQRV